MFCYNLAIVSVHDGSIRQFSEIEFRSLIIRKWQNNDNKVNWYFILEEDK